MLRQPGIRPASQAGLGGKNAVTELRPPFHSVQTRPGPETSVAGPTGPFH